MFDQIRQDILNHYTYGDLDFQDIEAALEGLSKAQAIHTKALRKREEKWDADGVEEWEWELMR